MRRTYSYSAGVLGALCLAALAYIYVGENVVVAIIGGVIGFVAAFFIVRGIENALYKGADAIERKVRSGAVSNEEDLMHSVVTFTTTATLSAVRQAVANTVVVKSDLMSGKMAKTHDTERGAGWEIGIVSMGEGCKIELSYDTSGGQLKAVFAMVQHTTKQNISPHIKKMMALRNDVITAFKTADPNVVIEKSRQELHKSRG